MSKAIRKQSRLLRALRGPLLEPGDLVDGLAVEVVAAGRRSHPRSASCSVRSPRSSCTTMPRAAVHVHRRRAPGRP